MALIVTPNSRFRRYFSNLGPLGRLGAIPFINDSYVDSSLQYSYIIGEEGMTQVKDGVELYGMILSRPKSENVR